MYQFLESQSKVPWSAIIFKIVFFIRICMVNGQRMPVQLICHTKPYNNRNFQSDGASQYFGIWVWKMVHLLILVWSFQWRVLFLCLAKLYRSCPIRDKGLFLGSCISNKDFIPLNPQGFFSFFDFVLHHFMFAYTTFLAFTCLVSLQQGKQNAMAICMANS